jgi:hypothetical protein
MAKQILPTPVLSGKDADSFVLAISRAEGPRSPENIKFMNECEDLRKKIPLKE